MRKKILYIITKSEPFGGAQRYVFELATSLPKEHFEVVVAVGNIGTLKDKLEESHIRTIVVPNLMRDISAFKELYVFFFLYNMLKKEKPDTLHLNSSKAGGLGALAGRIAGIKKIIFTGHGWAFNENRSLVARCALGFFHWITILLAHQTIAVSKGTRKSISLLPFVQHKIHTIYNGVPPIPFKNKADARAHLATYSPSFAAFLETHTGAFLIGINSELHNNKGIDIALHALEPFLKQRKNIALVITSAGEDREMLEKMAQTLKISSLVFFMGNVPDMRVNLKAYDLFLMPSRTEALPYALIEAGFASLPSIASSVGGIPEIIQHEHTGLLIAPNNKEALAHALTACLEHPETCTTYGEKFRESAEKLFPLQKMLDETVKLYAQ